MKGLVYIKLKLGRTMKNLFYLFFFISIFFSFLQSSFAKDIRLVILDYEGIYVDLFEVESAGADFEKQSDFSKKLENKYQKQLNQALGKWSYRDKRKKLVEDIESLISIKRVHQIPVDKKKVSTHVGDPMVVKDTTGYYDFYKGVVSRYPFHSWSAYNLNGINGLGFKRYDDLQTQGAEGILELRIINKLDGLPHKKEEKIKPKIITLAQLSYIDLHKGKIRWSKFVYDRKDKRKPIREYIDQGAKLTKSIASSNMDKVFSKLVLKSTKKLQAQ